VAQLVSELPISIFVAFSARNAMMSSGASRHHSPVEVCQRLHVGQPVRRSPQWSISTNGSLHCLQRLDGMVTIQFDVSAIWACPIHLTDLHLPQDQLQTLATF
jgi:hypothetical protein